MHPYFSKWFFVLKKVIDPKIRLFCFPYAGGSATVFNSWVNQLPEEVELVAIQLPGRGSRMSEPLYTDMDSLANDLTDEIQALTDVPYLFFGHSMGSRIAFKVLQKLETLGKGPMHFIASGSAAPNIPRGKKSIYDLPEDEFISELKKFNGTPEVVFQHEELMELCLPILRADFQIVDTYLENSTTQFNCGLDIWGGEEDEICNESLSMWSNFFNDSGKVTKFVSDHFFIEKEKNAVLENLNTVIKQYI